MNIFFLKFRVYPTINNENYDSIETADVLCWIREDDPNSAFRKAEFYISKSDWNIATILQNSIAVNSDDFFGKDLGLENYEKAKAEGMSFVYIGVSRDRKTTKGPIVHKSSFNLDINDFNNTIKQFKRKGRCLHYESGSRCNEYINAHSIQNKGLLSKIAKDGHVYGVFADIGTLKKMMVK